MERIPLVLGTAQLGMRYGIANRTGMPDRKTAAAILGTAWEAGIREFDTAQGYGNSEEVLGAALRSLGIVDEARIITKFHPRVEHEDPGALAKALADSLERLGLNRLYGLMLHRETLLDQWDLGLADALLRFVDRGLVKKIGVSVYSPARALQAIDTQGITMIQIPANILDRRFERAAVFERARQAEKSVYIRSIYLQGLLLMAADDLTSAMKHAVPVLRQVDDITERTGLSRMELAIAFVRAAYPHARLVIGSETPEQVRQNVECSGRTLSIEQVKEIQELFQDIDESILNSALWPA